MKRFFIVTSIFGLFLTVLAVSGNALSQEAPKQLTVKQILDKMMAKSKEHQTAFKHYTFLQRVKVEELDDRGKVEETNKMVYQVVPVGDTHYDRLIKKNGKALEGEDLEDEKEREREFRKDIKNGKKPEGEEEGSFRFDEKFVSKYKFDLDGEKEVNGRPAYVLKYKPKSDDLPENNMGDKFMNKSKGQLWVDKEDFVIVKAQTRLIEPVKILAGIAASIKTMDLTFISAKQGNDWFPSVMNNKISGRKLLSSFNTRINVRFDSFKKVNP